MKKYLLMLMFTVFGLRVLANSDVYSPIYPTTVNIDLKTGKRISEFKIFNTSEQIKTFEVQVQETDNFGQASEIAKYLIVFPKAFSLKPGETKTIRVMLKDFPKDFIGKGEYKGSLLVKGLTSKIESKYESRNTSGITTSVDVKIDVSMAVYVLTGNEESRLKFISSKKEGANVTIELENIGNYSYEIFIKGFDKNGKEISKSYPTKIIAQKKQSYILENAGVTKFKAYEIDKNKKEKFLLEKNI